MKETKAKKNKVNFIENAKTLDTVERASEL